jgi:ankyrin repeat protein
MKHLLLTTIAAVLLVGTGFADPIHTAAKAGDLKGIQSELDEGVDVNEADISYYNVTPLHYAAAWGYTEIVQFLIAEGADLNPTDILEGATPLHWAVFYGHSDVVKVLIEKEADLNAELLLGQNIGDTPLDVAIRQNYPEIEELLRNNGGKSSSIYYAAISGGFEDVKEFLDEGFEINERDSRWYDFTTLHHAAAWGHSEIVQLLIDEGANLNLRDTYEGGTPLHWAAFYGHSGVVKILIENKADLNLKLLLGQNKGYSSLDLAERQDNEETVKLLRTNGGNYSLIFYASQGGDLEAVKAFIEDGVDVNATNPNWNNFTALHHAATWGHNEIVQFLISKGAEINPIDTLVGGTPLHWSAFNGHIGAVKVLIDNEADMNLELTTGDDKGATAIDLAQKQNNLDIVELLREFGAKINEESLEYRFNSLSRTVAQLQHLIIGDDGGGDPDEPSIEKLQGVFVIRGKIGGIYEVQYHTGDNDWQVREAVTLQANRQLYIDSSSYDEKRFYRVKLQEE